MNDPAARVWRVSERRSIALDRARVVAILNVTPDSFSDGGALATPEACVGAARRAIEEGADALDLGGESTRPGADDVPAAEQLRRVLPALRALRAAGVEAPITIDTRSAEVAAGALDGGADGVNDVSGGLDDPRMLPLVAERVCGVVLMHRLIHPKFDRYAHLHPSPPDYGPEPPLDADLRAWSTGVVARVRDALRERLEAALRAGVRADAIVLDPGLGFGKSVEQNVRLIAGARHLGETLAAPLLCAASRKSFVGAITGVEAPAQRVGGSVGVAVAMRRAGFSLFRVHDVAPHVQALRVTDTLSRASNTSGG